MVTLPCKCRILALYVLSTVAVGSATSSAGIGVILHAVFSIAIIYNIISKLSCQPRPSLCSVHRGFEVTDEIKNLAKQLEAVPPQGRKKVKRQPVCWLHVCTTV